MTTQVRNVPRLKAATGTIGTHRTHMTTITTERGLLTSSWTADVNTIETAIGQFTAERPLAHNCHIVLFEIAGDGDLHVNVIHAHERTGVRGWLGPGRVPAGCVYNRRFGDTSPSEIIRHVREMVFA